MEDIQTLTAQVAQLKAEIAELKSKEQELKQLSKQIRVLDDQEMDSKGFWLIFRWYIYYLGCFTFMSNFTGFLILK